MAFLLVTLIILLVLVLISGIALMSKGGPANEKYGNKLMIARVSLQAAILVVIAAMVVVGR
ncbi:MAG: hypothetical protein SFT92_01255 [Rickettsiales bacterium]|nr:hypothetical protein [Rickettsiales bacterium]